MIVGIYARVSTEKQEKEETIASQIEQLENHTKEHNMTIVEKYIDDGYSGEMLVRPGLDRLRDHAKEKHFDAILITSPDRLARRYVHQEIVIEELQKAGVQVIFLNRSIGDTPEDKLFLGMQGLIAEYEKEKIKERTRRGRLYKAKRGVIVGGIAPFGYRYAKNEKGEGYYEVVEEEARIVRLIFDLCVKEQMGIRAITRALTQRGIPPQKGGNAWAKSSVARILKNETYTGTTYYNKNFLVEPESRRSKQRRLKTSHKLKPRDEWIPISVHAIISREIWNEVQSQLERNSRLSPRHVKHQYLLRGILKCALCGSPFLGTPYHGRPYYRCGNKQRRFPLPLECKGSISAPLIEGVVWEAVCGAIQNPEIIIGHLEELEKQERERDEMIERETKRIEQNFLKLKRKRDCLLDAYTSEVLSLAELKEEIAKVRNEEARLLREKEELIKKGKEGVPFVFKKEVGDWCKEVAKRLKDFTFEEKQKFLRLLVDEVTLDLEKREAKIEGVIPPPKTFSDAHISATIFSS